MMNNVNVKIINLNGSMSGFIVYLFICFENIFKEINGVYLFLNDVYYFGNVIFNMYNDWVGIVLLIF